MFDRGFHELGFYRTRRHRRRLRPRAVLVFATLGIALLGYAFLTRPAPLVIYNGSASAPLGFYLVRHADRIRRRDLVLVKTPESVRLLAAERHYLPLNVDLVKRVVALKGDRVCAVKGIVSIDGYVAAEQLKADREGRRLPEWNGCQTLGNGEVFLLMESVPDSFDSRYFGPVPIASIKGKLTPLWLK